MFLEPRLDALAKQRAVGQHHRSASAWLQQTDDEGQEQVCGFLGPKMLRKVALNAVLLLAAKGRVGQHDVHPVLPLPTDIGPGQGVVVAHEARVLNVVQQHIGHAQHMRQLFLLHHTQGGLQGRLILGSLDIALAHVAQSAGQKSARTAGRVEQGFAGARVDEIDHERRSRRGACSTRRHYRRIAGR